MVILTIIKIGMLPYLMFISRLTTIFATFVYFSE